MHSPKKRFLSSEEIRKITYSALYLAIALVLPFLTGQIPEIGSMLCPMHIPVLLCGFVCGWPWGLGSRLRLSAAALSSVWYACHVYRHRHGF